MQYEDAPDAEQCSNAHADVKKLTRRQAPPRTAGLYLEPLLAQRGVGTQRPGRSLKHDGTVAHHVDPL